MGRLFEGGPDLSTGEWQWLALARLPYREADVWILDEPTAALDAESESAVFAEPHQNLRGRAGVVIPHRFSTVRVAHRIAVIARGRVSKPGTHDHLMEPGGNALAVDCRPSRPVSVLAIHGTADPIVPVRAATPTSRTRR